MTLSKKKRRTISVGGETYFWVATGNDGYIDLCISSEIQGSGKLLIAFDYQYLPREIVSGKIYPKQFVITPSIVRHVIEYALSVSWKPFEKGKDFQFDDKIDIKFLSESMVEESQSKIQNPKSKIL